MTADATPLAIPAGRFFSALAFWFDKTWIRVTALFLAGLAVHFPALQGQFLWDDGYLAQANPFIKSPLLIFETFRHNLLLESFSAHYRPVQTVTYMFDYVIWNTDPYGFHLTSVVWHLGCGILLYFLLAELFREGGMRWAEGDPRRLFGRLAWAVSLIWVIHPVHSAAVDYISGRADSLAFFFAAGGWLVYARARRLERPIVRRCLFALAAVAGFLALCSRESATMWMLLFLVYLFALDRSQPLRRKLLVLVTCMAVVGSYAAARHYGTRGGASVSMSGSTAPVRATLMLRALGDYGRLMVFPSSLHMERNLADTRPVASNARWRQTIASEYLSVLGLAVGAALLFGALRKGRARNLRAAGAVWFVLAYLPTSNLLELNATVAEHWLYLPSVGFLLFAAGCGLELPARGRRIAIGIAVIAFLGFSARSFVRSTDWVDPETFYRRTLASGGASVRVALNLSQIYASQKRYDKAEEICRKVLQLSPDYPIARTNLGDILFHEGKIEEANQIFLASSKAAEEAKKEYPRTWIAALNVAHLRKDDHDLAGAIGVLEKARADYPGVWDLISFEAEVLREAKQPAAALEIVRPYAAEHWWHYAAALATGRLYMEMNDVPQAEKLLWHASWLDVHEVAALNLISLMRQNQSRFAEAYEIQRRAIARQPDEPRQYLMLSQILDSLGRKQESAEALAQVSRLAGVARPAPVPAPLPVN